MSGAAAGYSPDPFLGEYVLSDLMEFEAQLKNEQPQTSAQADHQPSTVEISKSMMDNFLAFGAQLRMDQPGTSAQADQPSTFAFKTYTVESSTDAKEEIENMEDECLKKEAEAREELYRLHTPEQREMIMQMLKVLRPKLEEKYYNPGRFLWLWFLGLQMPGIGLNGEPHIPLEIIQELVGPEEAGDLDTVIRQQNIYTRICDSVQHTTIREKCKEKEKLKDLDLVNQFTTLTLVARSDLHRVMGALRKDGSLKTKGENDNWNIENRVKVVHFNFADLYEEPESSESEDLCKYDYTDTGCVGYWYKGRNNMRCIECAGPNCNQKFTPNDFVVHDCRFKPEQIQAITRYVAHVGLDPNNWPKTISIKDRHDKENIEAWKKFSMDCQKAGKRAYDDAEPQAPPPKRIALEQGTAEEDDEDIEIDVEKINDEMESDDEVDEEAEEEVYDYESGRIYPVNVPGPSGMTTKICTAEECMVIIRKKLLSFNDEQLAAFQRFDMEYFKTLRHDQKFEQNCVIQQKTWQKIRENPKFVCRATSHFDAEKKQFVNMRFFNIAPKGVKMEIQKLTEEMIEIYENNDVSMMDRLKKEQELLRNLSEDAMRVLNNVPPPPPPPPPMPKPKAIPPVVTPVPITPITPISFPNINFAQLAQQLAQQLASGAKLPLPQVTLPHIPVPQVSPVVTSPVKAAAFTPSAPSTPVLPQTPVLPSVLPILPNPELLKAQLAIASPHLLPLLYPTTQFKLPTFEQISQFLKATAVKN